MVRRPAICALLLLLGAPLGQSQDAAALRRRLAEVQGRLKQVDQRLEALKKRRKGLLIDLQNITLQVERARANADGARYKLEQTQAEVEALRARQSQIHQELQGLRAGLRHQVRWMQATGPFGAFGFMAHYRTFAQFMEKDRLLTYWRTRERHRLERVQSLQTEMDQRQEALRAALVRLGSEQKEFSGLQAGLALQEQRLQAFLGEVQQDEGRQKSLQAELAEEALQLDRKLASLLSSRGRDEVFQAETAFAGLKGRLPRPTPGTLAQGFGESVHPLYRTRTFQSGIMVSATSGQPVGAVAPGKVFFAEVFQSYGPTVIVDHGDGWFTLYTHLQSLSVQKGQILQAGTPVGLVGDTPEGPRLGFQIRQQTTPQDPQKWLQERYP